MCAKYIALALLMFFTLSASGQRQYFFRENQKTFHGGLIGGMNISTVDGDTYGGFHKVGLNAGAIVYARISRDFAASISLTYTQKGSRGAKLKKSYYVDSFFERIFIDLNYVEIPVVLHWMPSPKFHYGIGAAYARLISVREDVVTDQPVVLSQEFFPFEKEEISISAQAAYQLGKHLFFEARLQGSVKTIRQWDKIPPGWGFGNAGQYNQVVSFRLMYLF